MPHSIFNTFNKRDIKQNSDINIVNFAETVIAELLVTNRQQLFELSKIPNNENAIRMLTINHINKTRPGTEFNNDRTIKMVLDYFNGYHLVQPLIDKDSVTDIRICNKDDINYKIEGECYPSIICFPNNKSLMTFIEFSITRNGGIITKLSPKCTVGDKKYKLRISATVEPVALDDPFMNIRIHKYVNTTLYQLMSDFNMINFEILDLIFKTIAMHGRIAVVGPAGSGKTTILRAIINSIPACRPSVGIEEIPELFIVKKNHFPEQMVLRGNSQYNTTLSDLTIAALRESNECICIGEVKSGEAYDILDAYNTGQDGMITFHVDTLRGSHLRFCKLVSANPRAKNFSTETLEEMFTNAFDLIIFMNKFKAFEVAEVNYVNKRVEYRTLYRYIPTVIGNKTIEGFYQKDNEVSDKFRHRFEAYEGEYKKYFEGVGI